VAFRAPQGWNDHDGSCFVGVADERDLAAIGRPGRATVAGIAGEPERFSTTHHRGVDTGVVRAIAVAKCDLIAVGREGRGDLKSPQSHQRHHLH